MLTIKHINPEGFETVFPALEVRYDPTHFEPDANGHRGGYVWYEDPRGSEVNNHRLEDGIVYVMNDAGKTVARYYLSGQLPPKPPNEVGSD